MALARVPARRGHKHNADELLSDTLTAGDILYVNSSGELVLLAAGTNGHVLTLSAGLPIWSAGGGGGGASQLSDLSDVNTSTPTNRNALVADGVDWESRALVEADISDLGSYITDVTGDNLSALADVTITAIASGELLKWNGSAWVNNTLAEAGIQPAGSYLTDITGEALSTLSDVTITTIASGELLKWNGSAWINNTIAEAGLQPAGSYLTDITGEDLSTLNDVTITSIASGELLKWNGSAWINNTLSEAGIAAASHTHAASDVTSGTFADGRISESSVTQHEAALTLAESQVESALASATAFTANNYVFNVDQTVGAGQDNYVLTYDNSSGEIGLEAAAGGGASQLSDLSDVNTSTATNRNVLVADGVDWESRALVEADISDLQNYLLNKEQVKYKTSDESTSSDTSYSDDSTLAGFTLDADSWYKIEGYVQTSSALGVDIKFRGSFTNTPQDGAWVFSGRNSGGTNEGDFAPIIQTNTVLLDHNNTNEHGFMVSGFIRSNAATGGTFDVQWAQNSSSASTTTVHAGSWLKITKLS